MSIAAEQWIRVIENEYFGEFLELGGSCIKFIVGEEALATSCRERLWAIAERRGMSGVLVRSDETRVHMIQDVFFAIVRSLDLASNVRSAAQRLLTDAGYRWPAAATAVSFDELARHNEVDRLFIKREIEKRLTEEIMENRRMAQDFRVAIMRLIYGVFDTRIGSRSEESDILLGWMGGTIKGRAGLGALGIAGPIGRHNARAMMRSLLHWRRRSVGGGLLLWIDLVGLWMHGAPVRYTPSAALDLFEVLRQLIDDIESFEGLLCVVSVPPRFLDEFDLKYSIHTYLALKARLWSDVRPKDRDNPLAPLVELQAD